MDLVAYGNDGLFAIEVKRRRTIRSVKRRRTIRSSDLRGLRRFAADYPMARCVLLFGGDRREFRGRIELLPLAEALADPARILT